MSRLLKAALVPLLLFVLVMPVAASTDSDIGSSIISETEKILKEDRKTLDDYGIDPADFEKMVQRMILLGRMVVDEGIPFKLHEASFEFKGREYRAHLARPANGERGLVFVATYLDSVGKVYAMIMGDVDEDGIPDFVIGKDSFGNKAMMQVDKESMAVYIAGVKALLAKEVYYPPEE